MWPYWAMFAVPAAAALSSRGQSARWRVSLGWSLTLGALTLLIGYRVQVGGDWWTYLEYIERVRGERFIDVLAMSDPGYQVLNWVATEVGGGIFAVNLLGGLLFSIGLTAFCLSLPRPWLAMAVSIPYLVIVVAMGYSRQAIALGLAMLGLVALCDGRMLRFVLILLLAATFHRTAVVLLPIGALATTRGRLWSAIWVVAAAFIAYDALLASSVDDFYRNYVEAEYQSQGALIRLAMNAIPAALMLGWGRRFAMPEAETRLWVLFSVATLVLLGALFITPATTAIDRIALYLLPLQLAVFAHLPGVVGPQRNDVSLGIVVYYAFVQYVWLHYAGHSFAWLPYRFYPLEGWL